MQIGSEIVDDYFSHVFVGVGVLWTHRREHVVVFSPLLGAPLSHLIDIWNLPPPTVLVPPEASGCRAFVPPAIVIVILSPASSVLRLSDIRGRLFVEVGLYGRLSRRVVEIAGLALLFERVPPAARVSPITFFLRRYR